MAFIEFTANLGADAEIAYGPNGNPRLSFRAADSKSKPDGNGGWEKIAEQWLNVTVWGPLAEHLGNQGLNKGTRVQVVGEFYARPFEKDGQQRLSLDVNAWGVRVLPSRNGGQQQPAQRPQAAQSDPWGTGGSGAPF